MAQTREQRNVSRRARYAENKNRLDACNKFSLSIMRHADASGYTARVLDYLERCIRQDRPANIDECMMTVEEASFWMPPKNG